MPEDNESPQKVRIRADGRIGEIVGSRGSYLIVRLILKEPGYPDEEIHLTFHQDAIEPVNDSP